MPTHPADADGAAAAARAGAPQEAAEGTRRSAEAPQGSVEAEEPVTSKGLPKRTPKITAPAQAPRQRTGSVDAEALRRRLGGFRSGAQAGYRAVEVEIEEQTAGHRRPTTHAHAEETTGGTAEEASS
ncbi:hypothetical protein [Streptomyces monashensis]|uniref:hypothetical protein n=1 Tax=Streptomyces monashensis TaxID=1678012 RepID=UPI003CCBC378